MSDITKIGASHLSRAAYVYLRQSSAAQVEHNRESTQRQYALERVGTELNRRGFPKGAKHDSSLWPGGGRRGWRMKRLFAFG